MAAMTMRFFSINDPIRNDSSSFMRFLLKMAWRIQFRNELIDISAFSSFRQMEPAQLMAPAR